MLQKILGSAAAGSLLLAGVASAQTTTATTTPGVPNTGAGDLVVNVMVLAVSALIAIGGALYLYTSRALTQ